MTDIPPVQAVSGKRERPSSPQQNQGSPKKQKVEKVAKRCFACRKKSRPIPFKCKCERFFCLKHLHDHDCGHDYKKEQREILKKQNPKVVADKIPNRI
jgi:hypothetical protein